MMTSCFTLRVAHARIRDDCPADSYIGPGDEDKHRTHMSHINSHLPTFIIVTVKTPQKKTKTTNSFSVRQWTSTEASVSTRSSPNLLYVHRPRPQSYPLEV